jgi:putative acetyltransferase
VTVWTVWSDEKIAGMGALKNLGGGTGELKSMRTHPDFLRRGVASVLLEHIIDVARARGMARLSLETGSGAYFEPALSLYRRRGFVDGDEFADYKRSAFNQFLHLTL